MLRRCGRRRRRRVIFTIIIKCMFLPLRAQAACRCTVPPMVYKDYKFYRKALRPLLLFSPRFFPPGAPLDRLCPGRSVLYERTGSAAVYAVVEEPEEGRLASPSRPLANLFVSTAGKVGTAKIYLTWNRESLRAPARRSFSRGVSRGARNKAETKVPSGEGSVF